MSNRQRLIERPFMDECAHHVYRCSHAFVQKLQFSVQRILPGSRQHQYLHPKITSTLRLRMTIEKTRNLYEINIEVIFIIELFKQYSFLNVMSRREGTDDRPILITELSLDDDYAFFFRIKNLKSKNYLCNIIAVLLQYCQILIYFFFQRD